MIRIPFFFLRFGFLQVLESCFKLNKIKFLLSICEKGYTMSTFYNHNILPVFSETSHRTGAIGFRGETENRRRALDHKTSPMPCIDQTLLLLSLERVVRLVEVRHQNSVKRFSKQPAGPALFSSTFDYWILLERSAFFCRDSIFLTLSTVGRFSGMVPPNSLIVCRTFAPTS